MGLIVLIIGVGIYMFIKLIMICIAKGCSKWEETKRQFPVFKSSSSKGTNYFLKQVQLFHSMTSLPCPNSAGTS